MGSLDLNAHLINRESVAVALMFSSDAPSIGRCELIAPQWNGFIAASDPPTLPTSLPRRSD